MKKTHQPKRSLRENVYGNWVGYVGRVRTFGFGYGPHAERVAKYWLETGIVDDHACYN